MVARDAHRPLVRDRGSVEYFRGGFSLWPTA
jgi:hypothetical protein